MEKLLKYKDLDKIENIILVIYTVLLNGFYTLNGSVGFGKIKLILLLAIVFGIVKIIFDFKTKIYKHLYLVGITLLIAFIFYLNHTDTRLAVAILTMYCLLDEDIDKIIKCFFYSKLFFFAVALLTGGYMHINGTALHGGMVILLYACMKDKKTKWTDILVVFIAFLALSIYTDSGSAKIGMAATIILLIAVKTKKFMWIYKSKLVQFTYPIIMLINVYFAQCVALGGKLPFISNFLPQKISEMIYQCILFIDKLTSSRLTLAGYSLKNLGTSFFGGNVDYSKLNIGENGYFNLDSGFMWLLQDWGYFMTFIFCIMTIILIWYFIKKEKYNYVVAALVIALWGINEDMILSVGTNFLIAFTLIGVVEFLNTYKKSNRIKKVN